MKTLFALVALTLSLSALAAANVVGEFVYPHKIGVMGGYDKESCLDDKGEWDEEGICLLDTEDTVTVTQELSGLFSVRVSTVTTNTHMCDFEGSAKRLSENVLLASASSEKYVPGENGGEGSFVPVTCELTLTYGDDNTVSVSNGRDYSTCSYFCGANASLDIEKAVRK